MIIREYYQQLYAVSSTTQPKLTQHEIGNLNSPVIIKEVKCV